jgi:hypothetical protein
MSQPQRLKAYVKLVNHVVAALAALFELITGEPAPRLKDVLQGQVIDKT